MNKERLKEVLNELDDAANGIRDNSGAEYRLYEARKEIRNLAKLTAKAIRLLLSEVGA